MTQKIRSIFLDDIEKELGIPDLSGKLPIGSGKAFKGVYDRQKKEVVFPGYEERNSDRWSESCSYEQSGDWLADQDEAKSNSDGRNRTLDGASAEFDRELVDKGELGVFAL